MEAERIITMKVNDLMKVVSKKTLVHLVPQYEDGFTIRPDIYFHHGYTFQRDYGDYFVVYIVALSEGDLQLFISKDSNEMW